MKYLSSKGWRLGVVTVVIGAGVAATRAQFNGGNIPVNAVNGARAADMDRMHMPDEEPYTIRDIQARQLRRLREEHQKEVFSDTNRLVQLATSLKAQVDKGNVATLDIIKDADEIGKLAKRVSERIKTQ